MQDLHPKWNGIEFSRTTEAVAALSIMLSKFKRTFMLKLASLLAERLIE
jgi:hypothetical protein